MLPPCTRCNGWHVDHPLACDAILFRDQAPKYGMVSLCIELNIGGTTDSRWVAIHQACQELYPKMAYKVFLSKDRYFDIFVEDWALPAVKAYYETEAPYAGLSFTEYLTKILHEPTANK